MEDTEEMGHIVDEMRRDSGINANWTTYSTLASMYIKLGHFEKAENCLKDVELRITEQDRERFNYLINLYSSIDYCSTLEGDESWKCWRANFELKDLERESSKEDVEKLLIQSGRVKTLMGCLNGIEAIRKLRNRELEANEQLNAKDQNLSHFPIPDCLPKTQEELEEEEEARMLYSPFTRLLRSKGKSPTWCSVPPDHETD
ncbi:hypothetical protein CKAN_00185500 [Cinnamomum micranthum f. kanehirae]|uniref:Pentatricopeptide repeat-containing protein n=1 Tax=Cinnamomum micranthum f. kanehirae TaxID=337451 RepID=A0A3S3N6D3_9MAGN|nr:hypothetical protein CKAN_00185500 [Cinnamomum micranthum f. kanehirae]